MFDCVYCGKPCIAKQGLIKNNEHIVCVKLKEQRYRDKVCVRCGAEGGDRVQCEKCRSDTNAPYIGFGESIDE